MKNLIDEIQTDILNNKISTKDILLKALILANELNSTDFIDWITRELDGYNESEIPEYRHIVGELKYFNLYHWIPVQFSDNKASVVPINQSISELESLSQGAISNNKPLVFIPSSENIAYFSKATGYDGEYKIYISHAQLDGIVQKIRKDVLSWILTLKKKSNANTSNTNLDILKGDKMQKKYQIFISSTYTDLIEERQKVIDAILLSENIPIGMEMFKGSNDSQWDIIKRTIDSSDYYVLIVAHKYGSLDSTGISYTEKEYDYAKSINIPVYCFLIDASIDWSIQKTDSDVNLKAKLDEFKTKIKDSGYVKFWNNKDQLAHLVDVALIDAFKNYPRPGWIRNNVNINITNVDASEPEIVNNANKIIQVLDKLKSTRLKPATFEQIHEETQIPKEELHEEIEFLRGRGVIIEMGMGFGDGRMFYR